MKKQMSKKPCLDTKMSQISLRCKKCRKNQLACVEKGQQDNDLNMF